MELKVGSNIMIHFLYILLLLIWHMYLYILYCWLIIYVLIIYNLENVGECCKAQ